MVVYEYKVILNNCVLEIKVLIRVRDVNGVDYNLVLGLYVIFNNYFDGVLVWNLMSGKVVVELGGVGENFCDMLFVLGDCIVVSLLEVYYGGVVQVFSFDKSKCNLVEFVKEKNDDEDLEDDYEDEVEDVKLVELVIEDKYFMMIYLGVIVLFLRKNFFVIDVFNGGEGVYEIFIDWDNLKVFKFREIIFGDEEVESGIILLCCFLDFKVVMFFDNLFILLIVKVCMNLEEEVEIQE